jgi:5-methylcytosine-specific restriction endonuclease McrA
MPTPMKIMGRSSSITNAFINSIIPVIQPTESQVKEALSILDMDNKSFQCSYCGSQASEWDHLRPLVVNKLPTGYVSEIQNLIPSCGKCNQSKGNKEWRLWMNSDAKLSPKTKGIKDIDKRIRKIEKFEEWCKPTMVDFESLVGANAWREHWENHEKVLGVMKESQKLASDINIKVAKFYKEKEKI